MDMADCCMGCTWTHLLHTIACHASNASNASCDIVRYRALLCAIGGYVTIRHRDGFVALLMSCSGCVTVPTVATVAVCPEAFAEELP